VTEESQAPREGIAEALHDLSDHTAALAQREVRSAVREMWQKARQGRPAAALLATGGVLALAAAASAYRLSLRLLERRLSPAGAAFAAATGYGAAAVLAGAFGYARLRKIPLPLPADTAGEAASAVEAADRTARQEH
jgi:putative superfamily III holin-X